MDNNELIYRDMRFSGAVSITLGILMLVIGVISGVLLLISGGRLMAGKQKVIF